jgi:anaerobic C4-dicarboxylate transporter DcuA
MIVMLAIAALTTLFFKASPESMLKGTIMHSGVSAVISILGVAWLGSSSFEGNRHTSHEHLAFGGQSCLGFWCRPVHSLRHVVQCGRHGRYSCARRDRGRPPAGSPRLYPAANSVFFFPTYGTVLAAVSFDQTGTARIGKLLLNHSVMLPGLVTVITSVVIAPLLGSILLK